MIREVGMSTEPSDPLMRTGEVIKYLELPADTETARTSAAKQIHRWIMRRKVEAIRMPGGHYVIRRSVLDAILKGTYEGPPPDYNPQFLRNRKTPKTSPTSAD
jgi:hypothetical protein